MLGELLHLVYSRRRLPNPTYRIIQRAVLLGLPPVYARRGSHDLLGKSGHSVAWMVCTQIVIILGGVAFTLFEQVTILAAVSHNDAAAWLT